MKEDTCNKKYKIGVTVIYPRPDIFFTLSRPWQYDYFCFRSISIIGT